MRITILGSGSADGWPNPFCVCHSCSTERAAGRARQPSSALVDDVVLIDCGPTTPHLPGGAAPLDRLEHLLITHGHPDHLHPAVLLTRQWAHPTHCLHVWGPSRAIDLCRDWVAPDALVEFHVLAPGDDAELPTSLGTYRLSVWSARHAHGDGDALAEEALLFTVADPQGARLLYATDTGPFPVDEVGLPSDPVDVLLMDETFGDHTTHGTGHLDLATMPIVLADLRAGGVVTQGTRVLATHLSHHNPPTPQLRSRLGDLGIEVAEDGMVVDTSASGGAHHHLVLGGARSGKSHYAEMLAAEATHVTYVATSGERPDDPEWLERVRRHRERRPQDWATIETTDLGAVLTDAAPGTTVLVDCLALWLTAVLDDVDAWSRLENGEHAEIEAEARRRIEDLVAGVVGCPADLVLVSNEVGMGVVPATASGRLFRDLLGALNALLAQHVRDVTLMVAGRPMPVPTLRSSP